MGFPTQGAIDDLVKSRKERELFTIEPVLSPRLRWMERHSIHVIDNGPDIQIESESNGWKEARYCAYSGKPGRTGLFAWGEAGWGDTQDEAIVRLAQKLNIRLWNEV